MRPPPFREGSSLPRYLTSFIGRDREIDEITDLLLRDDVPLITLTGPGGVGKTSLAIHVVAETAKEFADSAVFVDLSPIRDPNLLLAAIAMALGIRESGGRDIDELVEAYLRPRDILLVLDNFEQVLGAAPLVAALIARCPALTILATSRAPLRLYGEHRFPVPPLPLPVASDAPTGLLAQVDSVRLFLDRARAVDPSLDPKADELGAIAEICRRLDGLPLAIELAATRSALLPPRALLAQLSTRLHLLSDGPRDLPSRQQTMRNAIAWSYDLLRPEEQTLFRRLAVFVDGFDLEAATAIVDTRHGEALGRIGRLAEQSLVRRAESSGDKERFTLLETFREFGWEQLGEHQESDGARQFHATYYLNLAERIGEIIYGPDMRGCLDILEREYRNFRAALDYFVETGDVTGELRLAAMLSEFWSYRGQISEGIAILQGAIDRDRGTPPGPRAKARSELAFIYWIAGDDAQARFFSSSAVPLAREAAVPYRLAEIMYCHAIIRTGGDGRETIAGLREVIDMARAHEPPLPIYPSALADLGKELILAGELETGVALLIQGLEIFRASGRHMETGWALLRLGRLDWLDGNVRNAAAHLGESLRSFYDSGIVTQLGYALAELENLATSAGYPETAARLIGMTRAIGERTGVTFSGDILQMMVGIDNTGHLEASGSFSAEIEAGRSLPLSQAVAEAIAIADALSTGIAPPGTPSMHAPRSPVTLSAREHDVLALLAQRYTAPEIAEHLYVSVRTVEHHVASIYNKLGVNSRRAATALAARYGMV